MPTGSERTVWGMGDGSTLDVVPTELGRIGGLICWENYMPLARFHQYSQGVDIWLAPTLATGDGWIATMRHIAREGRVWVIGVNSCVRVDQIPADFPDRDRVWHASEGEESEWVEPGNTVICDPNGEVVAGPLRHEVGILTAEIDLDAVSSGGGCSTPSATTTAPTSSSSPSTSGPGEPSRSSPTDDAGRDAGRARGARKRPKAAEGGRSAPTAPPFGPWTPAAVGGTLGP